jgi:catechol 2,3-dioxygenase-like lactoylglutathione lyase family enzyme
MNPVPSYCPTCMSTELFAGTPVQDFAAALAWYERLLGTPAFYPNDIEAVWELAPHRYAYIVEEPEHAGHAVTTVMVDDFDDRMAAIADQGIEPDTRETYDHGVRKTTYVDPDGNRFAFGSVPVGEAE